MCCVQHYSLHSDLGEGQNFIFLLQYTALNDLPLEENTDQYINPGQLDKYVGDKRGIQGHQNSCYLDSTVFGLFAGSDAFDNMFLEQQGTDLDGDAVKNLLWKGIVNPLRKYVGCFMCQ